MSGWWERVRYGQPVVVVSGLPRSGTSMLMKMLEAGGMAVASDGVRGADDDNPKGYYLMHKFVRGAESKRVKYHSSHPLC